MKPSILFFDVGNPGYLPVIRDVSSRGFDLILTEPRLIRALVGDGIAAASWDSFVRPETHVTVQREMTRISNDLADALSDPDAQTAFSGRFGSFLPHTGQAFFNHAMELIANEILIIESFETLIQATDLKLVVFGCDNNHVQRALVAAARQHGVPTLQMAHGIYYQRSADIAGETSRLYSDYIAVYGETPKQLYIALGNDADRVLVTGAPLWDSFYDPANRIEQDDARARLGLDPSRPVLMSFPSYNEGVHAHHAIESFRNIEVQESILHAVASMHPQPQLLVRPHPLENHNPDLRSNSDQALEDAYLDWARSFGVSDVRILRDQKIEAIRAADIAIVEEESTVIPELMILDTSMVVITPLPMTGPYTEEIGISVANDQNLASTLRDLLENPAHRAELRARYPESLPRLNHLNDGRASERMVEAIVKLASPQSDTRPTRNANTKLRALLAYRSDVDVDGGAAAVMKETAKALQALDIDVDLSFEMRPPTERYDILHAFNIWQPSTALEQLRYFQDQKKPIVWNPFYLHWCESHWANLAVRAIYDPQRSEGERKEYLIAFTNGSLIVNDTTKFHPNEAVPGFHEQLREMLEIVDHSCVTSTREIQELAKITNVPRIPFTVTPHGVDAAPFRSATPDLFHQKFGIENFLLCVAAVDARKNQIMLVEALKGTGIPLVLIGPCFEPDYLEFCTKHGENLHYLGRQPKEVVASALKAARAHALPSYAEGAALANLEAAVAECPMIVSNRSSEFEYFGSAPYYCDPTSPASIQAAAKVAYQHGRENPAELAALSARIESTYTWSHAAELTLKIYRRELEIR